MSKFGTTQPVSTLSNLQTTATPFNGKEAKQLLKIEFDKLLDNTPGLDFGTSYHRLVINGNFKLSAYPSDTPTPVREFEKVFDSPSTVRLENEEHFQYIRRLETIREELVHKLSELTSYLDQANPTIENEFVQDAGNSPDQLRIESGLPIPVVTRVSGKSVETYVDVNNSGGKFQFGKKAGE
jgi:hypothetical protein